MAIRKRLIQANYLLIKGVYEFLGMGFTELNESPSAQTTSKRYIHQASATQTVTGYKWASSYVADQIENEKAIEYIREIGEMLKLGNDTETDYLIVDLDMPGGTKNTFRARKRRVSVSVDSFDDNDGELGMSGSFLGMTDPVEGTFDTQAKVFTPGFTIKTHEVPYTKTGAVSAISIANLGVTFDDVGGRFMGVPHYITSFTFKDNTSNKTATRTGDVWDAKWTVN